MTLSPSPYRPAMLHVWLDSSCKVYLGTIEDKGLYYLVSSPISKSDTKVVTKEEGEDWIIRQYSNKKELQLSLAI